MGKSLLNALSLVLRCFKVSDVILQSLCYIGRGKRTNTAIVSLVRILNKSFNILYPYLVKLLFIFFYLHFYFSPFMWICTIF